MNEETPQYDSRRYRFTDPMQKRVHDRLGLVGPGPAQFFKDACQIMANPRALGSSTHLVGHLLREIESALRDVLESFVLPQQRVSTDRILRSIARFFRSLPLRLGGYWTGKPSHKEEIRAILHALDVSEREALAVAWLKLAGGEHGLHGVAHRAHLAYPRSVDKDFEKLWTETLTILDGVLDRFEARYAEFIAMLDQLLQKAVPSKGDIKKIRGHLPNGAVSQAYFFDKLSSPEWLNPLRAARFFKEPTEPEEDPDGAGFRLPAWPPGKYLSTVAKDRPKTVLEIILEATPTRNSRVHADFIDAARQMPPGLAAQVAPLACQWLGSGPAFFLFLDRGPDLAGQLAAGGQFDAAFSIARTLLELSPKTMPADSVLPPEPTSRFEPWFYGDTLNKLSALRKASPRRWLEMVIQLLADAVRLSIREEEKAGPEDHSHWWRPAIEDHEQNEPQHAITDRLIVAVRDAAELIVSKDPTTMPELLEQLERQPFKIFRRLALHLLRAHLPEDKSLVVVRLTNRDLFEDPTLQHEYFHLLKECFASLDVADKEIILGWIEDGPNVDSLRGVLTRRLERPPTNEELQEQTDHWRFLELAPIADDLPVEWTKRFDHWSTRFARSDHPDFAVYSSGGVWSGFPSPKTAEELGEMTVSELTQFLSTWQPTGNTFEASPQGLSQRLSGLVTSQVDRFSIEAESFIGLDATYARAVIDGVDQAVRDKQPVKWDGILKLCQWIVDQPRDMPAPRPPDSDPSFAWARKAVARLIGNGLAHGPSEIPIEHRNSLWKVISVLTTDPEPTREDEDRRKSGDMDPSTMSINTVRGDAMHTAVKYGIWVRRHFELRADGKELLERGFNEMPELRELLDSRLDVGTEPTLTVRSVYGQYFPFLALIDPKWAAANREIIFPTDQAKRPFWEAAWHTYVTFSQPYNKTFPLLMNEYSHAVDLISSTPKKRTVGMGEGADHQLAEHLMVLYWRGRIGLDDPNGLVGRFFERAPTQLRAYALEHVGRALSNTDGQVASEILDRLKALWHRRLSVSRGSQATTNNGEELAAFAWWFRSGKFDNKWSLEQLIDSLKLANRTYREGYLVMEHLAKLSVERPLESIECARLLVEGDPDAMLGRVHRDELRTIIRAGLNSGADPAQRAAREFANRLVARGEIDFREML